MQEKTTSRKTFEFETAKEFYEGLLTSGLRTSAERIWHACNLIETVGKGETKITVGSVARICTEEFGGPKAQSIRNQPETLKRLVTLRDDALILTKSETGRPTDEARFSDPNAVAYFRVMNERLRQLERSNNRLRSILKNLDPSSFDIADSDGQGLMLVKSAKAAASVIPEELSYAECESLRAFLRVDHLDRFGLEIDAKDRIVEGRSVLMESAALAALRRLATR